MLNTLIHQSRLRLQAVLSPLYLACLGLLALILTGCPTSNTVDPVRFARTPFGLHIDTVANVHPFCRDPSPSFSSEAECIAARKFKISWDPPDDTSGLIGYRFFLDTNAYGDIPTKTTWSEIQTKAEYADLILTNTRKLQDSIIFAVGKSNSSDKELDAQNPHLVLLDTSGRFPKSGSANMAVVAVYVPGHDKGEATYGPAQIGDRYPPIPLQIETQIFDTYFKATWERPVDAVSFFNPDHDSGIIREYRLNLKVTGFRPYLRAANFRPQFVYTVEGDTVALQDSVGLKDDPGRYIGVQYTLPDGGYFHRQRNNAEQDQLALTVTGLTPLDTLSLQIVAIDMAGNSIDITSSAVTNKIILTDTTEPEKPELSLDSTATSRNRLVLNWIPSRDSVLVDGELRRAEKPDQGIFQYRLRREWLEDSLVTSKKDSVIPAGGLNENDQYIDSLLRLPPGKVYRFILVAVDSSGHLSPADTLIASTLPVSFAVEESSLTCPPGFIPMPGKSIYLGDTSANAQSDERPAQGENGKIRKTFIASFCIEPQEHQEKNGSFVPDVSWFQADSICKSISPDDSTRLCSEAQWERACEGGDSLSHIYGYQGDRMDPSYLLGECNQGTGDSVPAINAALRSKRCLTNEGVFDMPGEYSEWVLDVYDSLAFSAPIRAFTLFEEETF
jgi:hypothetical protein